MDVLIDIDSKLVSIQKVTGEGTDIAKIFDRAVVSAEQYGQSISKALDAYVEFSRQGFKGQDLGDLSDAALIAANVGEISSQQAAEHLTASLVQWQRDTSDAMGIIDSWNELANNYATTVDKLARGQNRAGATARAMGLSYNQLNSIIGVVTASTKQSGDEVGNFVKNVLPRLVGAPAQKALKSVGVSLTDSDGNMRDVIEVYTEVGKKIQNISDVQRIAVVEGLAGKFHISRMQVLLNDLSKADSMYRSMLESSENSGGSAFRENEVYMKSLEAKIALLKVEFEKLSVAIGNAFLTDGMFAFLNGSMALLGALSGLVKIVGVLPPLFGALAAILMLTSRRALILGTSVSGVTKTFIAGAVSARGLSGGIAAVSAASQAGTISTTAFTRALTALKMATIVGAAIAAVGFVIEKLIGVMGDARRKTEELESANKEMLNSYGTNAEEIDTLANRYKVLNAIMNTDGLDNSQLAEYRDIQNQIGKLMPSLATGEDQYGKKLIVSSDALQVKLKLLKEELALEKERAKQEDTKKRDENIGLYEDDLSDANKKSKASFDVLNNSLKTLNKHRGDERFNLSLTDENGNPLITSMEAISKKLKEVAKERKKAESIGDTEAIEYYKQFERFLTGTQRAQLKHGEAANKASIHLKSEYVPAIEDAIIANGKLEDSLKETASGFSAELIDAANSTNVQGLQTALGNLFEINTDDARIAIRDMTGIFTNLENATSETFDSVAKSSKASILTLSGSLTKLGLDTSDVQFIIAALQLRLKSTVADQEKYKKEMESTGQSYGEMAANALAASDGTTELSDGVESATAAFKDFKDISEELAGVSQAQIDHVDNLILKYEQLSYALAGYSEDELATLSAKKDRTDAENELVATYEKSLAILAEMEAIYPAMINNEGKLITLSSEKLEAIRKENKANATLIKAYKDLSEGKLTEEQKMTVYAATETKKRIDHIKKEILSLEQLRLAYAKSLENIGLAIDAMSDNRDVRASLDLERQYQRVATGADLLAKNNGLQEKVDLLSDYQSELDGTIGRIEKFTSATDESNKSTKETGKDSIYITDKYKQQLEAINLEIEKQIQLQSKLPEHSKDYEKSLRAQLKLEKEKLALYEKQASSLQGQISSGKIQQTGTISSSSSKTTSSYDGSLDGWDGVRTQGFGGSGGHRGVDLAKKKGSKIDAVVGGKVVASGRAGKDNNYHESYGNLVVIEDSNGLKHIYAHLQKTLVKFGDIVEAGTQVGTIGNTGRVIAGKGGDGSHLHYEVNKNGKPIDPNGFISDAKAGKISTTTSTTSSGAPSTISTTQESIDKAKSDLNGIHSDILQQQQRVSDLEIKIINAPLIQFEYRRSVIDANLEHEEEKLKGVDKTSSRYAKTIDLQRIYLERKQNVNKEELAHYERLINSGTLSAEMLDEQKDKLLALKTQMLATANATDALALSMLDVFEARRVDPNNILEYENVKIQEVDTNSERYVKTVQRMIGAMKDKQKVNQSELDYLKAQISSGKFAGETLETLKARFNALTTEVKQLSIELKDMNYDIVINIKTQYDEKMDGINFEIERSKIIQSMYDEGSADADREIKFQLEKQNQLREETRKKIADLEASLLNHELNPDDVKELRAELRAASLSYQQLSADIIKTNKDVAENAKKQADDLADKLINSYKKYQEERKKVQMRSLDAEIKRENDRHKAVMDNYKKELDTYKKNAEEKIQSLDRNSSERSYQQEMDALEKERTEIVRRINLLALDDSHEATAKRKELQEQLDKIDKDIENKAYDRSVELQKQELNDAVSNKEEEINKKEELADEQNEQEIERLERLKQQWEDHYEALINDERKFSAIRKAILAGDFEALKTEFGEYITELESQMPDLENTFRDTMQNVGTSVRENVIDTLREAMNLLNQFEISKNITGEYGSSGDFGTGGSSTSTLSKGNMQVLLGKFLTDVVRGQAGTSAEKEAIGNKAHQLASEGRNNGSTYSKEDDFYQLIGTLSKADLSALSSFFTQQSGSVVNNPILQSIIKNFANQMAVSGNNYIPPSQQVPPSGGSSGSGSSSGNNATMSQGDKQVLMAKYMKDVLLYKTSDKNLRADLIATADKIAQTGRNNNSNISTSIDFSDALAKFSKSQVNSFGVFLRSSSGSIANKALQNELIKYANSLASLDVGGMTKNWGSFGGVDGKGARFGLLHPEEIINNPLDSKRLLTMANVLERATAFLSPALSKLVNFTKNPTTSNEQIVVNFGDVYNATQTQAENFASSFVNTVRVKKGGK